MDAKIDIKIFEEKYQTPLVMLNGKIIQSGGKLSERVIKIGIETRNGTSMRG